MCKKAVVTVLQELSSCCTWTPAVNSPEDRKSNHPTGIQCRSICGEDVWDIGDMRRQSVQDDIGTLCSFDNLAEILMNVHNIDYKWHVKMEL